MVKIVWSNAAKEDLKEIKAYISKDSPEYAQIFTECLFEKLKLLELFPKMVDLFQNPMILMIEN